MKKFILSFALLLVVALGYSTNVVPVETAMKASKNFLSERMGVQDAKGLTLTHVYTEYSENGTPVFYRFQVGDKGFMIVSATDLATPVLAYSLESNFKEGTSADFYGEKYKRQLSFLNENPTAALKDAQVWNKYASDDFRLSTAKTAKQAPCVEPLVTTKWTQETYYNTYCPVSSQQNTSMDNRTPVGCVALTMSNIMYYYRFPASGVGAISYIPREYDDQGELIYTYPVQAVNLQNTNYNYDAMANSLGEYNGELSKLIYNAGVSVQMSYGFDGSGSQSEYAITALQDHFKYSSRAQFQNITDVVTTDDLAPLWVQAAKEELDAHRPIFFSGASESAGGHAWIVDGYTTIYNTTINVDTTVTPAVYDTVVTEQTYFHVNWGWAGSNNGYYLITNQYSGSYGNFNVKNSESMMLGLAPEDEDITKPTTGDVRTTAAKGTISDGAGNQLYQPNTNRSWVIACPNATAYSLKFSRLKTKAGDKVTIYNGGTTSSPVLAEYSGEYLMDACADYANLDHGGIHADFQGQPLPAAVNVNKDSVLVVFSTNADEDVDYGFVLDYEATQFNIGTCEATTPIMTDVWNAIYTDKANNATDETPYRANSACKWQFRVPQTAGYSFNFRKFDLKAGDFVEFYDLTQLSEPQFISRYDINNMPEGAFEISLPRVMVKFVSDNWQQGNGFELEMYKIAGIDDMNGLENVNVYPNPATDNIHVRIEADEAQEISASVVDMTGKTVYVDQFNFNGGSQEYTIPVNAMAKGFYFLNLQSKQGKTIRKFIVE